MNESGWIPEGSTIQTNEDETLTITPPTDYIYAGYDLHNSLMVVENGVTKVSCTCNTTGKCMPFVASGPLGDTSGCSGDCTNCTMTQSIAATGDIFNSGGYLNLTAIPKIITVDQEYPASFEAMYDVSQVQQKMQEFIDQIYQGQPVPQLITGPGFVEAPEGYLLAFVDICGRAVLIPIPEGLMVPNGAGGVKSTCSCTQGTCTLKSKDILIGKAEWCDGNCTGTCSLTTGDEIVAPPTYSAPSFIY